MKQYWMRYMGSNFLLLIFPDEVYKTDFILKGVNLLRQCILLTNQIIRCTVPPPSPHHSVPTDFFYAPYASLFFNKSTMQDLLTTPTWLSWCRTKRPPLLCTMCTSKILCTMCTSKIRTLTTSNWQLITFASDQCGPNQ